MPSIMYKLLVNPPAHKGPKMVARPPTERLTPWLNPFGDTLQRIIPFIYTHSNMAGRCSTYNSFFASHMLSSNLLNRANGAKVK